MADAKIQASELLRNLTLRVRIWIGTRVIRLGAAIIGCNIELVE